MNNCEWMGKDAEKIKESLTHNTTDTSFHKIT